jgi:hypothetical protein
MVVQVREVCFCVVGATLAVSQNKLHSIHQYDSLVHKHTKSLVCIATCNIIFHLLVARELREVDASHLCTSRDLLTNNQTQCQCTSPPHHSPHHFLL